jgi:hypothetical protein
MRFKIRQCRERPVPRVVAHEEKAQYDDASVIHGKATSSKEAITSKENQT